MNPKQLSPLTLAFIGDAVFELYAREEIINKNGSMPVNSLHKNSVKMVNARSQSKAAQAVIDNLTSEELNIYKRGRNANTKIVPKSCTVADYHSATGLEALFGYLYLGGQQDRLRQIFDLLLKEGY